MHLRFLELPLQERRPYFEQAAQQRGILPVILEKDFCRSHSVIVLTTTIFKRSIRSAIGWW